MSAGALAQRSAWTRRLFGRTAGRPPEEPLATDPRAEEVRVALALNGGVSLAVWMGGCGVELDCARRAHLGTEAVADGVPERAVYAALCRAFGRLFVVDVMSGASAGGINGALLGAAIAKGRRLHPDFIREKWLNLGDFDRLMQSGSNPSPQSLLQGKLFTADLRQAFDELVGPTPDPRTTPPPGQRPAPLDVDLDITTTDLTGTPVRFRDHWHQDLEAREYRAMFRFRKAEHFEPERLAASARASASFPLAFEPFQVTGAPARLASFDRPRWVLDGGLLDNAPIAAALELIPTRAADRQVRRFVCYLNADPVIPADPLPGEPTVATIAGHLVNLPREAPFVDQLHAIELATRRGLLQDAAPAIALLDLELKTLEATATVLLPAYQRSRLLLSLEEILGQPAKARATFDAWGDRLPPWIPATLAARGVDERWQWGLRPAQRALYLLLDAIRRAARDAEIDARLDLFAARAQVDEQLLVLEGQRGALLWKREPSQDAMSAAINSWATIDPMPAIEAAVAAVVAVADRLGDDAEALFGPDVETPVPWFLRRALAVEVVRRALSAGEDIESAQELRFAALTPNAPGLLFTAAPWSQKGWSTPTDKVLGIQLGHFAGFYRRSWRANDFMWGRLDAAARIVDMLVSPRRAQQLRKDAGDPPEAAGPDGRRPLAGGRPWELLADALLPDDATAAQHKLVDEALAGAPGDYPRESLAAALEHDLTRTEHPGRLTRILCTRAVQLEILAHELLYLERESKGDVALGAGTPALDLGADLDAALESLRAEPSLAKRLLADDEVVSRLAVRTGARASLAALAVLRSTPLPVARLLSPVRAFLLSAVGSVARWWGYRAAVLLGFWSAALFLGARVVQTQTSAMALPLDGRWLASVLVAAIALLVVAGVVLVPGLRAARASAAPRRLAEGVLAVLLLLTGAGAILIGLLAGLSLTQAIAAPGAKAPPAWVLGLVLAPFAGIPLAAVPAVARGSYESVMSKAWAGKAALLATAIAAVPLAVASVGPLGDAIGQERWRSIVALLALAGAPLIAFVHLFAWRR